MVYTVKVSELITHIKKFEGTQDLVRDFGYIADLLGPLMGCFLFQLPPSVPYSPALLDTILPGGEGCWDTALVMSSIRRDRAGRVIIGGIGNGTGPGARVHAAWARRKLAALYPALRDIPLTHGWTGRIAMTGDHIPKIVAFGPDAYAIFGYSGRGIGPGTVFGTEAARALLSGSDTTLPLVPIRQHRETAPAVQAAYYETGATLTHAMAAR